MATGCSPPVELDENITLDSSTAPTTPEGSLSFSPVLRPLRPSDGIDDDLTSSRETSRFITPILSATAIDRTRVENICCVGAGYVGGCLLTRGHRVANADEATRDSQLTFFRGSNCCRHGFSESTHQGHRSRQGHSQDQEMELAPPAHLRTRTGGDCSHCARRI